MFWHVGHSMDTRFYDLVHLLNLPFPDLDKAASKSFYYGFETRISNDFFKPKVNAVRL
jgi:hypothetical protein